MAEVSFLLLKIMMKTIMLQQLHKYIRIEQDMINREQKNDNQTLIKSDMKH